MCLHFAGVYYWKAGPPPPESSPVLVAICHGEAAFRDSFTFTPTGNAYRNIAESTRIDDVPSP